MSTDTKTMDDFVPISGWIPVDDAEDKRQELIERGIFTRKHVRLSSARYADYKDFSKGLVCRVMATKGFRPDLEVDTIEANSIRFKKAATNVEISDIIGLAIVILPLIFLCYNYYIPAS